MKYTRIPTDLPTLPEGHILLGEGGEFETGRAPFEGSAFGLDVTGWTTGKQWDGTDDDLHYTAPADSDIAALNLGKSLPIPEDAPEPPQPPEGHVWVSRGYAWWDEDCCNFAFISEPAFGWSDYDEDDEGPPIGAPGLFYLEAVPLPVTETPVGEWVPFAKHGGRDPEEADYEAAPNSELALYRGDLGLATAKWRDGITDWDHWMIPPPVPEIEPRDLVQEALDILWSNDLVAVGSPEEREAAALLQKHINERGEA